MKPPHEAAIEFDEDRSQPSFSFFRGPPTAAQIQAFESFAKNILVQGVNGVWKEFKQKVMRYRDPKFTKVAFCANEKKNRYSDVFCGDATRVILPEDGYIHANHVKGAPLAFPFILTQGPLPATVGDFWKMIDVCKVNQIVMLCDNVELGRQKCEPYVPKKPGDVFEAPGGYKISFANGKNGQPDVVKEKTTETTKFLMQTPTGATRKIRHYHYSSWPDVSTPPIADMVGLAKIMEPIRNNAADQAVVVHCSAGIGRTGTLVAIEMCLHQLLGDPSKPLSLVEVAKKLRDQRPGSIQVEIQYLMIPVGVFDYGIKHGYIKDPHLIPELEKFTAEYDRLSQDEESPESLPPQSVKILPPPPPAPKAQTSPAPATAKPAVPAPVHPPVAKQPSAEKTAPLLSAISAAPACAMTQASAMSQASTFTQASAMSQASAMTQASVLVPNSAMTQASTMSVQQKTGPLLSVRTPESAISEVSVQQNTGPLLSVREAEESTMSNAASAMTQASTMSQQKTGPLLSVRQPESAMSEAASCQKTGPLLSARQSQSAMTQASTFSSAPSTMSLVMTAKPMPPIMAPPAPRVPVPRVMPSLGTKTAMPMPPRPMPAKTAAPPHLIAPIVPPHPLPNPPIIRPPVPHPPAPVAHPPAPVAHPPAPVPHPPAPVPHPPVPVAHPPMPPPVAHPSPVTIPHPVPPKN